MKTMWVVVREEYEDTDVACVFEDEADAEAHAAALNAVASYRGFDIATIAVYPPGARPGRYTYWYGHARGLSSPHVYSRDMWEYDHETGAPPPAEPLVTVTDADSPYPAVDVVGADADLVRAALHATLRELRGPDYRPPGLFCPALPQPACYRHSAGFMVHAKSVCRCKGSAPGMSTRCPVEYERPGGRQPGDRIVKCHLEVGHPGEHEEAETGVTWPWRDSPRRPEYPCGAP